MLSDTRNRKCCAMRAHLIVAFIMRRKIQNCPDNHFLSFLRQLLQHCYCLFYQFCHNADCSKYIQQQHSPNVCR